MFELLNVKWGPASFGTPSGTISWSSEIGGDLPIASGSDLGDITSALRSAFDAWENVAAVDFEEVSSGGAVTVGTAALSSPTVGQAGPFPVNPTSIFTMTSADVDFSSNVTWAPFGGGGGVNFFAVAVHEIGHVIGLAHPDPPDSTQLMNEVISVSDLSDVDIAGAQFIYGTDGSDEPVDPTRSDSSDGGGGGGGAGLLVGLLALIASLFTGGGALVAMAAGRVAMQSDEDEEATDPLEIDATDLAAIFGNHSGCDLHVGEDGGHYHGVTVAEMLPSIDFTAEPNPCGCVGLCEHIIDQDNPVEDFLA